MQERLTRSQVPVEQTWNLDDIFPTVEAWEEEYDAVSELIGTVTKYKGRLGESAQTLLQCLNAQGVGVRFFEPVGGRHQSGISGHGRQGGLLESAYRI
mgnify:CR=1 FL=1